MSLGAPGRQRLMPFQSPLPLPKSRKPGVSNVNTGLASQDAKGYRFGFDRLDRAAVAIMLDTGEGRAAREFTQEGIADIPQVFNSDFAGEIAVYGQIAKKRKETDA